MDNYKSSKMKTAIVFLLFFAPFVLHAQKKMLSPQVFYYDPKDTASLKALMREGTAGSVSFQVIDTTSIPFTRPCVQPDSIALKEETLPLKNSVDQ